jgi:hypothetical protein
VSIDPAGRRQALHVLLDEILDARPDLEGRMDGIMRQVGGLFTVEQRDLLLSIFARAERALMRR